MELADESACLILGASGTVGRFLTARLRGSTSKLLALSRREVATGNDHIRWIRGDLYGDVPDLHETPVQLIYSVGPLDGLAQWLRAARLPSLRRVVALSSMSLEVKAQSRDPAERDLAARLASAEREVIDFCSGRDIACVVLRPTLIYGGGSDRSLSLLAKVGRRWRVFPSIPGATGLRQPIHADDLAAACVAAMAIAGPLPKILRVGGAEQLTFGAMLSRTRGSLSLWTIPVWIPMRSARALLRLLRLLPRWRHLDQGLVERLQQDQIVDNEPAMRELNWHPGNFDPGRPGTFLNNQS
ncbi:MAG: hypothetical protein WAV67_13305 [Dokdonella sp.]